MQDGLAHRPSPKIVGAYRTEYASPKSGIRQFAEYCTMTTLSALARG